MVGCIRCSYIYFKDVFRTVKIKRVAMNKVFKILFEAFLLLIPVVSNAQKPKDNLGKTTSLLRQIFPILKYLDG